MATRPPQPTARSTAEMRRQQPASTRPGSLPPRSPPQPPEDRCRPLCPGSPSRLRHHRQLPAAIFSVAVYSCAGLRHGRVAAATDPNKQRAPEPAKRMPASRAATNGQPPTNLSPSARCKPPADVSSLTPTTTGFRSWQKSLARKRYYRARPAPGHQAADWRPLS
ncbi:uncharacterized protein LOC143832522 [Paroedura picta]|uniref:uncharacterized protein LOC143832522 n=1 Tax=Paroedura picta TaxID=143630 RepID=UPI004057819C